MNVVIVGAGLPYPATSGNRIRTSNLTTRLAARHRVTFVAIRNPDRAAARPGLEYLRDHRVNVIEVGHVAPKKSGAAFYARLAANLTSRLPYSVASYTGPAFDRALKSLAARGGVDLWQAEWVAGMESLRVLGGVPKLVMAHNVETLIWERYAETERNPLKRWYVGRQVVKFERFERRSFARADRVVAVSLNDAALVCDRFGIPAGRVDVVDNGIDRATFEGVTRSADYDLRRILFLGSLDWRPNQDALELLLGSIFPEVRAAEPGATLQVVGRNPPPALARRVAETPGVTLHADVPDVRPYLASAGLLAVPLRIGGGSRLKILEALAAGLPVVSTRVGAEGLDLRSGRDLVVVDDPRDFAPALVQALRDPAGLGEKARNGRALVLRRYDWDSLADALERSWERCLARRAAALTGEAVA